MKNLKYRILFSKIKKRIYLKGKVRVKSLEVWHSNLKLELNKDFNLSKNKKFIYNLPKSKRNMIEVRYLYL